MKHRCLTLSVTVALLLANSRASAQEKVRVAELSPQAEAAIEKGLRYIAKDAEPPTAAGAITTRSPSRGCA